MYGIDHYQVIVAIAIQVYIHYVNIQLFVVHMQNRTIPAQTNNIVITQRLLSRPYSIPAQFEVNTNYNGFNRHCTSLYINIINVLIRSNDNNLCHGRRTEGSP